MLVIASNHSTRRGAGRGQCQSRLRTLLQGLTTNSANSVASNTRKPDKKRRPLIVAETGTIEVLHRMTATN